MVGSALAAAAEVGLVVAVVALGAAVAGRALALAEGVALAEAADVAEVVGAAVAVAASCASAVSEDRFATCWIVVPWPPDREDPVAVSRPVMTTSDTTNATTAAARPPSIQRARFDSPPRASP